MTRIFPFVLSISVLILLSQCKNETPLGGPDLPLQPEIVVDTISINQINEIEFSNYIGNKPYASVGWSNDPVVGDIKAEFYFLPRVLAYSANIDTLLPTDAMRIEFSVLDNYGDSLSVTTFELLAIDQYWRANSLTTDSVLTLNPTVLSTVSVPATADSFLVDLPQSFVSSYVETYYSETNTDQNAIRLRDSAYVRQQFGFALRAQSTGAIQIIDAGSSQVEFITSDTSYVSTLIKNATKVNVENAIDYSSSEYILLDSKIDKLLELNIDVSRDSILSINATAIPSLSISKAELILSEDTLFTSSQRSRHFFQPNLPLKIFQSDLNNILDKIVIDNEILGGFRSDGEIRINLTSYINGIILNDNNENVDEGLYAVVGSSNGVYSNALFFGPNSPTKAPKIVITYIQTGVE